MRSEGVSRCGTLVAAVVLMAVGGVASGQAGMVTDRPDFTESAVVVAPGTVQLEGGLTWARSEDDSTATSGPELLVRWGLSERLELRFVAPDRVEADPGPSGWGDGSVGMKLQLGPLATGWDLGLIAAFSVPVGDGELSSDEYDPELILAAGRELGERWSLGAQASAAWPREAGDRDLEGGLTVVLGRSLSEASGTFFELAAELPAAGTAPVLFHHGYTWSLSPAVQLDLHLGAGLTDTAPELLAGAGLSVRL